MKKKPATDEAMHDSETANDFSGNFERERERE